MTPYDFLLETYATERLKTLSVWSQIHDDDLDVRPEPRARTPREHFVHQCVSEDGWMRTMLGITVPQAVLPPEETRVAFLGWYADASAERLRQLEQQPAEWFAGTTRFFDVERSRAWVLTRRLTHSAHHRGQLTAYLRLKRQALYSTYGPTADTGGLPVNHPRVIYRYPDVASLLEAERRGGVWPPLPGRGDAPPTERPTPPRTAGSTRTAVVALAEAMAKLPGLAGERFAPVFDHGTLQAEIYAPRGQDAQQPHPRDEVYVVVQGSGTFFDGAARQPVAPGAFLFVPAGRPHRFEGFTDDFAVWVLFYGPDGGEADA